MVVAIVAAAIASSGSPLGPSGAFCCPKRMPQLADGHAEGERWTQARHALI